MENQQRTLETMNKSLLAIDRRFDAIDKYIMDDTASQAQTQALTAMSDHILAMERRLDDGFDAVDRRFDALEHSTDKRFDKIELRLDEIEGKVDGVIDVVDKWKREPPST